MASLIIRQLDPEVKTRLRVRAAEHGRSMEAEAREILSEALGKNLGSGLHLYDRIRAIVEPLGGIELDLPPREPVREPPDFRGPEFDR